MSIIGRNEPCPCGSGKKYKQCHGAAAAVAFQSDSAYDRIRRIEGEASDAIMKFIAKRYGKDGLARAFEEFGSTEEMNDPNSPQGEYFIRWITYNWRPNDTETAAEQFLKATAQRLDPDQRRLIEATLAAPYSFHQVLSVIPGESLTMRDILLHTEFTAQERAASRILQPGSILFARAVTMDGVTFMMGNGSCTILPHWLNRIMELRTELEETEAMEGGRLTALALLANEEMLREEYFDIEYESLHPQRKLVNRDNEPLLMHTITYTIDSAEAAFHALKSLQQDLSQESDEDILATAVRDEHGMLAEVKLHWLKEPVVRGSEGNVIGGTITITATSLEVETNSAARAEKIQEEIRTRLGQAAQLVNVSVTSPDEVLNAGLKKSIGEAKSDEEDQRRLKESPEVQAMMREMMEKHWREWPDIPLPGLRNMTPRNAATDPVGRELLESMLLDFEQRNNAQEDEFMRVDVARLRRELGLTKS